MEMETTRAFRLRALVCDRAPFPPRTGCEITMKHVPVRPMSLALEPSLDSPCGALPSVVPRLLSAALEVVSEVDDGSSPFGEAARARRTLSHLERTRSSPRLCCSAWKQRDFGLRLHHHRPRSIVRAGGHFGTLHDSRGPAREHRDHLSGRVSRRASSPWDTMACADGPQICRRLSREGCRVASPWRVVSPRIDGPSVVHRCPRQGIFGCP